MNIKIRVNTPSFQDVYTLRKWGDPVLIDLLGATTDNLNPPSNFQVIKTATIGADGKPFFNDIKRFQVVDYNYLKSLQYADDYTVQQKMNWLVNVDGEGVRPYWMKGTSILYFGPLVFGGQKVQLGETMSAVGQYPNRDRQEIITFRRLIGVRKNQNVTYKTHPHLIQHATEAGRDNKYNEFPRGEIFHPVWSDIDHPANYGDGKLWIAVEFLEAEVK